MVAHPTVGRVALLLDPEGVRSHWIDTPDWDRAYYGLAPDNSIVQPRCRCGPERLPLKPGEWNRVELKRQDNTVILTLNDTVVFERPLSDKSPVRRRGDVNKKSPEPNTRFGLFRYQTQSSKVRNAMLSAE